MWIFDLTCYMGLFGLLIFMTRVRSLKRVRVRCGAVELPGVILKCHMQLHTRIGLLNTPGLRIGDGLLLNGVCAIHTLGMHFPIDVLFLDESARVLGWESGIVPGIKKLKGPPGTRSVLELGSGTITQFFDMLKTYDQFEVTPWMNP